MVHVGSLKVEEVKEGRVVDGERGHAFFVFLNEFVDRTHERDSRSCHGEEAGFVAAPPR